MLFPVIAKPPAAIRKSTPLIRVCVDRTGCAFATEVKIALSVLIELTGVIPFTQLELACEAFEAAVVQTVFPVLSAHVMPAAWERLAMARNRAALLARNNLAFGFTDVVGFILSCFN